MAGELFLLDHNFARRRNCTAVSDRVSITTDLTFSLVHSFKESLTLILRNFEIGVQVSLKFAMTVVWVSKMN